MPKAILVMDMPTCCDDCFALDDYGDYPACRITQEQRGYTFNTRVRKMDKCPLKELPEKRKYINMNEYKVGDKFVIEIKEIYENVLSNAFEEDIPKQLYRVKGFESLVFDKDGLDKLEKVKSSLPVPYSEAYKKGMNDAWDIARELCKTGYNDCTEMFGDEMVEHAIKNFTPLEIKEKIESFKKEKEINVGDVVTVGSGDITFICTKDNSNGDYTKCHLVAGDGSVYEDCDKFDCQKTGKSIDIGEILKEIDT